MNNKSPQTPAHRQVISKILDRLAEVEQPLSSSLEFYRLILTTQNTAKLPQLSEPLPELENKAKQHLAQGKPAITFSTLKIDWDDTKRLFNELMELAGKFLSIEAAEIENLKRIGSDLNSLKEAAKAWFGCTTSSHKITSHNNNARSLQSSIFQATFYPLLSAYADRLLPLVPQDSWYKKYCPICGGNSDLAFLDKEKEGSRWLLCSRCDTKWLFSRLVCPYCGNDDQQNLAYFTDDTGLYRLYVCEKCRRYIKAIDLRKTEAEVLLPLERILTLDLDRQAHESHYKTE